MRYDLPGRADAFGSELVERWNEAIRQAHDSQWPDRPRTRFFRLDPADLRDPQPTDALKWPGEPRQPSFCVDEPTARALCDWGMEGRRALHIEYCEYAVIEARDAEGRRRPKRVEVTTELREYWSLVAMHDPDGVRAIAAEALGREPAWEDLYGVADPHALSPAERELAFCRTVGGHGNDERLVEAGIPAQPEGRLNAEHALFMTHPINGLDDIFYVVLFGAHPYAVRDGERHRRATAPEIYTAFGVQQLGCNHADPAITLGVHASAYAGREVAFDGPVGMYIRRPNTEVFAYRGEPVPDAWVRLGRGEEGFHQRLVFGPPDDDDAFLDDVTVAVGAAEQPLTGGYQLVRELEIGLRMLAGPGAPVADDELEVIPGGVPPIACNTDEACRGVAELARRHAEGR